MEIERNFFFRAERLCTLLLCRQTEQKNVHGASLQVPGWGEGGLPEGGGTHRFLVHATTLPAPFTFPQIGALHPIQSLARREGGLLDLPAGYTGGTFSVHFRGGTVKGELLYVPPSDVQANRGLFLKCSVKVITDLG